MEMNLITPLILSTLFVKIGINEREECVLKILGCLMKMERYSVRKKIRRFTSLSMTFSLSFSICTVLITIWAGNK